MFSLSNVPREEMMFTEVVLKECLEVYCVSLRIWFSLIEKRGERKRPERYR
jgi:hypothetical protein